MFHGEKGLDTIFTTSPKFEEDLSTRAQYICKQLAIAKGSLILDQPFFGYILSQFEIVPVTNGVLKFAVDQKYLYLNSEYFEELFKNPEWKGQVKGILIHLLIHIIFRHHKRQKETIPKIWGLASDIVVFNYLNVFNREWMIPNDWVLPSLETLPDHLLNHTVEETYRLLMLDLKDEAQENEGRSADNNDDQLETHPNLEEYLMDTITIKAEQMGLNNIQCDIEEMILETNPDTIQDDLEEQYFEGMLRTAYDRQKGFGSLPEGLDRFIQDRLNPIINWRVTLSRYLQQIIIHDLSWSRPNKRLLDQGYYFPGPLKEDITVVLAIDTSGSIDDTILMRSMSEIQSILLSITNIKLIVIDCDAEIQQIKIYEAGESISRHSLEGGGGTDFRPVFDKIKDFSLNLLLYITDGQGIFPTKIPDIPVVWILSEECLVPFGSKILLDPKYMHSMTS